MAFIHGCQQADVLVRVFASKTSHRALSAFALTGFAVLGNQSGDLLAGIAADFLNGTNNLELYHLVNGIDVVDAFALVQVTLMYCIYADVAWFAIRPGLATLTDTGRLGSGFLEVTSLPGVGARLSQVIQVTHRY